MMRLILPMRMVVSDVWSIGPGNHFAVVSDGQTPQVRRVDAGSDCFDTAIAEHEQADACMPASEFPRPPAIPADARGQVIRSLGKRILNPCHPTSLTGPRAAESRAVTGLQPTERALRNVLLANQEGVTRPVGDATQFGVAAETGDGRGRALTGGVDRRAAQDDRAIGLDREPLWGTRVIGTASEVTDAGSVVSHRPGRVVRCTKADLRSAGVPRRRNCGFCRVERLDRAEGARSASARAVERLDLGLLSGRGLHRVSEGEVPQ